MVLRGPKLVPTNLEPASRPSFRNLDSPPGNGQLRKIILQNKEDNSSLVKRNNGDIKVTIMLHSVCLKCIAKDSTGYAMKAEKAAKNGYNAKSRIRGDIMSGKFMRMYVNPTLE